MLGVLCSRCNLTYALLAFAPSHSRRSYYSWPLGRAFSSILASPPCQTPGCNTPPIAGPRSLPNRCTAPDGHARSSTARLSAARRTLELGHPQIGEVCLFMHKTGYSGCRRNGSNPSTRQQCCKKPYGEEVIATRAHHPSKSMREVQSTTRRSPAVPVRLLPVCQFAGRGQALPDAHLAPHPLVLPMPPPPGAHAYLHRFFSSAASALESPWHNSRRANQHPAPSAPDVAPADATCTSSFTAVATTRESGGVSRRLNGGAGGVSWTCACVWSCVRVVHVCRGRLGADR
jgi:hypothetical protein